MNKPISFQDAKNKKDNEKYKSLVLQKFDEYTKKDRWDRLEKLQNVRQKARSAF